MNVYLIGVVVSIAVYMVIGLYAGRSVKDVNDYYVSGRNAPTLLITGTLFASMLSVGGLTGDPGWCYSGNVTAMVFVSAISSCGFVIGPLVFGRYLRRSECNTMPEYFGTRYHDFRNRRVAAIIIVISLTIYLVSSITGVGVLMQEITGLPYGLCLFLTWISFTLFTFYSGSKGVVLTDTIMFMVFMLAFIISCPYVYNAQGGFGNLLVNLMNNPHIPEGLLDFHGNLAGAGAVDVFGAVMNGISLGIVWLFTLAVSPWQAGRNMMAKNEHVIIRSGSIAAILQVVVLTFVYLQSVAVLNIEPFLEDPERVLIWAALNVLPKLAGTVMLAGIMAAGLSSASTFLSVIGFSVASDVFPRAFKDRKEQMLVSRIAILVVGIIALIFAYMDLGGIRIVYIFATTAIAASWGVPAIGSAVSKKMSATGARWSMIAGFLGFIVSKCLVIFSGDLFGSIFVNFLDPFFVGLYLSLIFAVIGSKKQPPSEQEHVYRTQLMQLPQSERVAAEYAHDRIYGYIMIVAGIAETLFLLFGWALPYNGLI